MKRKEVTLFDREPVVADGSGEDKVTGTVTKTWKDCQNGKDYRPLCS